MNKLFRCGIFISSYIPLWITIIVIDVFSLNEKNKDGLLEILSIIVISLITSISIYFVYKELKNFKNTKTFVSYNLQTVKKNKTVTKDYILAHTLPLFAFDFKELSGIIQFLIFFITIGYLSVKHNYFSMNIFLEFLNYNLYTCKLKVDGVEIEKDIICKVDLSPYVGSDIDVVSMDNNDCMLFIRAQS